MKFKKGTPKPPASGRKPGTRNKLSTDTKQIIMEVAEELGGIPAMLAWAKKNRTAFYVHLFAKLIPKQIDGEIGVTMAEGPTVRVVLPWNGRCDPALLGDQLHVETAAEFKARTKAGAKTDEV